MEQRNWHKVSQTHQYCMMKQRNWHKASQTHQSMKYLPRTRFATLCISNFLSLLCSFFVVLYCLGYRIYQVVKNLLVSALLQFLSVWCLVNFNPWIQEIGEKLSEIGSRLDYPLLTKELANEIKILWEDAAIQVRSVLSWSSNHVKLIFEYMLLICKDCGLIDSVSSLYMPFQETYSHGNILQVPDCAQYFMENLERLSEVDYVPTKVAVCLLDLYSPLHHFTPLCLPDHYIQTLKLLVRVPKSLWVRNYCHSTLCGWEITIILPNLPILSLLCRII